MPEVVPSRRLDLARECHRSVIVLVILVCDLGALCAHVATQSAVPCNQRRWPLRTLPGVCTWFDMLFSTSMIRLCFAIFMCGGTPSECHVACKHVSGTCCLCIEHCFGRVRVPSHCQSGPESGLARCNAQAGPHASPREMPEQKCCCAWRDALATGDQRERS